MIYFDNAATTFFKPPQVIDCVLDSLKNPANANRGGHSLSVAATAKITEVRNKVHAWSTSPTRSTSLSVRTAHRL